MSGLSGTVEGKEVILDTPEDGLRWRDLQTNAQTSISDDEIVCVLPGRDNHDCNYYTVLFIDRRIGTGEPGLQRETPRLASLRALTLPSALLSRHMLSEIPNHLKPPSPNGEANVHVVISTFSGTGTGNLVFNEVLKPFLSHLGEINYQAHETESDQTIIELARSIFLPRAQKGIAQTIILLSGDGGLVDMIGVFFAEFEEETLLAVPSISLIPTGTGNAMASSIGLLSNSTFGLAALLRGRPLPLPTFQATFSPHAKYVTDEGRGRDTISVAPALGHIYPRIYGAVVASWGMHAAIVADSDTAEYRKFGADRFKMAAKELLYPPPPVRTHRYKGTIKLTKTDTGTGKERVQMLNGTEHMYVLTTMVSNLEKGFTISPASTPLDGRLRVIHFSPMLPDEALHLMGLAYQGGRHVNEEAVAYEEIVGMRIEVDEEDEKWRRVCIDGKIVVVEEGGWMDVRRERRRLLNLIACTP